MTAALDELFSLRGRVALVTGGTGTLGRAATAGLAAAGATVAVLSRTAERAQEVAEALGNGAIALAADVRDRPSLEAARDELLARLGRLDILVNFAGGNLPAAIRDPQGSPFGLDPDATREVLDLNLMGTALPISVFGPAMLAADPAPRGGASIVTVASVSAGRPLTRVAAYSAAKAAVLNLTRGLAVELGREHQGRIRVNALVPGFFLAEQNRSLLTEADGTLSRRGRDALARTPLGRFGHPAELVGALVWLSGPSAAFVTGTAITVDGGFSAESGV
jgi:NAD(P)-dependent dehydrogenase (short-subunit alcohol dehydrogenase family)